MLVVVKKETSTSSQKGSNEYISQKKNLQRTKIDDKEQNKPC